LQEKTKKSIIISPHPDDEIIGCFDILQNNECIIIYSHKIDKKRREESLQLKKHMSSNVIMQFYLNNIPPYLLIEENTFYFPDPIFENHPDHRYWGAMGEKLLRENKLDIVFYSVNMNAPYIYESSNSEKKKLLLDTVYESQKDLWKYDHKYFLFEGYCKWLIK